MTRRAPRGEQAVVLSDTASGVRAVHSAGAPWFTSSHVGAAVERAPQAEVRRAGNERVDAAAAGVRDAADGAARGGEDHLRVAGLDRDRADGPVGELLAPIGPFHVRPPFVDM